MTRLKLREDRSDKYNNINKGFVLSLFATWVIKLAKARLNTQSALWKIRFAHFRLIFKGY
nr:MAG TPA: hypothetical protein [Caudoviricetes sp.]